MKTVPRRKGSVRWRPAMMSAAFLIATGLSYAGSFPSSDPTAVVITKNLNSRKHKIRLFTASDSKTLLFTVDGVAGKHYTLFVFDLDGKLIAQSAILNHETGILPLIHSGGYLYDVFVEDHKVESGQLTVKQD
ncbi:MAG TPA: hypothetical protein VGM24_05980 [Puia sp.]